jgi:phosphoglycerol transferase MdoB-like AlkP superfamily enzyme
MFSILLLSGLYLLLLALLGRGLSNILIITLAVILSIADFIKIRYFGEPFYPWDIFLVKEFFLIAKDYINAINVTALVIVVILIILAIFKNAGRIGRSLKPKLKIILIPFALMLILVSTFILNNKDLSAQINIHKTSSLETEDVLSNGVLVQNCFYLSNLNEYLDREPDKYSYSKMKQLDIKYRTSGKSSSKPSVQPNIIMIMSESFWDVTQLKGITFNKDLTPNLRKYQKGELASPAIGGGTANVEFEALTGMSMFFLNPGAIPYNIYINSDTLSIASALKSNGYKTIAIHPNVPTMYNRNSVYKRLGFDTFMDVSYFNYKEQAKGRHVSDDALIDKILGELDKSTDPSFIFAVTMQNHDPYIDKYKKEDLEIKADGQNLTDKDQNILSNYGQGIYDADKSLGKLINSLSKNSKPTLVYYFGDHAPRIGSLQEYYNLYDQLGSSNKYSESLGDLKYYMTPLATWSNYSEMRTFDKIISPAHLSYQVLNDAKAEHPNYFNILPQLEKKYPILHIQDAGKINKNDQLIKDYEMIQYDLLFGHSYYKK